MSLTETDFDWVCELVRRESAIVLEPGKEYLAETRLHPIAKRLGFASVGEFVAQTRSSRRREIESEIVDALTTNETSFFRDLHPWQALREEIVPGLLKERTGSQTLTVWCGAASSGQEPFSLALMLREHFAEELEGWTVRIVATDISETMLARCRAARFSQLEVNRGLPAPMLLRWFRRDGMEWRLSDEIRSMIEFRAMNLSDPDAWRGLPQADLVLLRNVLIYFDVDTKRTILGRVLDLLRPDGGLLLGSSETTIGLVDGFVKRQHGKTIWYQAA